MDGPRRTTVRTAALPARTALPGVAGLLPSRRSVVIGAAFAVLAAGAYLAARTTSMFAVQTLDVRGGTPALRASVRAALADEVGRSLLAIGGGSVASRLDALPDVRTFSFDRDYPHTLRVVVHREYPVLVLRRVPGSEAYLVAASGKVLRQLSHPLLSHLPRVWVKQTVPVVVGERLPGTVAAAASALGAVRTGALPRGVTNVSVEQGQLTLRLASGFEVRLGDAGDLSLKLAIARRILHATGAAGRPGYLDVSVPGRTVLAADSRVEG
ncbi:MAG TPA: cell division protein FtsQ/DivIB [Gaiellaceae bacterium]|nr:cell division protein FtsQ/DivIB [Gaiellaceae bacterium]